MRFNKAIRSPSWYHEKEIDITDEDKSFEWNCIECKEKISVSLKERLTFPCDPFPKGDFSEEERKEIREYYVMGEHSRSPCGGGMVFENIGCPLCKSNYLFAYGLNEPSNSYLVLTVQGIVHIDQAEQGASHNAGKPAS
ncbi:hypothetical protein [Pelagicoccus sp. SDUM812002]|uniref:hypothetical protein n=1 Tax=Pelagicoccus sp. SDUM812002 TaxID=3041266 RepID=UPI00280F14C6|nr:hypothetical protein [Pelagicoccus sp. SDUM812002]MDQ8188593.1 hypothetical protein [Pelagicoccus sp. SDUM812002]